MTGPIFSNDVDLIEVQVPGATEVVTIAVPGMQGPQGIKGDKGDPGSAAPDATSTIKGLIKLTGDLGGTADSPTVVAITSATDLATGNTLARRDSTGYSRFSGVGITDAPSSANHATRKDYVDSQAAASKRPGTAFPSASFTLGLGDEAKRFMANSSTSMVITIPADATVSFPLGAWFEVVQWHTTGTVTVTAASGVSIRGGVFDSAIGGSVSPRQVYSLIRLTKISANFWLVEGDYSTVNDQAVAAATSSATGSTMVKRDSGGGFAVSYVSATNQPGAPEQLTRKDYVDGLTKTASQISDSTAVGRSIITATDAAAARTAIGAGTSSLVIGTTSTTAKAGDYSPPADAAAGVASMRTLGTGATQAAAGNDSRLSDARTPTAHTHTASQISDSTATGRSLIVATDAATARTAIGAGTGNSNLVIGTTSGTAKDGAYQPTAANISDATTIGRTVLTSVDAAAVRTAIGAGTSNLVIGTTSTTAKAGDYSPPADAAAGVASMRTLGTGATQAVAGNDSRLSDARTPTAHTHTASQISDSTAVGRSVLTATDATAVRTAIGAGTGNVVGTGVTAIVSITQAAYTALGTKDASTLYVIVN